MGDKIVELAQSIRDVGEVWRRYQDAIKPPYAAGSPAAVDVEQEAALCLSGTRNLTNLVLSCNLSMVHASDQIKGMAACTEAPDVGWAMYACARTALVATARTHYLASGETTIERLRRHLNDELGANSANRSMAFQSNRDILNACKRIEKSIRQDGEHAGLIWRANQYEPYFASSKKQNARDAVPSGL